MEYLAFDAHKRYTQVLVESEDGQRRYEGRIAHARGALQQFLTTCERGSPVAVETVGTWDWIVDEIEAAGQVPQLVHARQAKLMLGLRPRRASSSSPPRPQATRLLTICVMGPYPRYPTQRRSPSSACRWRIGWFAPPASVSLAAAHPTPRRQFVSRPASSPKNRGGCPRSMRYTAAVTVSLQRRPAGEGIHCSIRGPFPRHAH